MPNEKTTLQHLIIGAHIIQWPNLIFSHYLLEIGKMRQCVLRHLRPTIQPKTLTCFMFALPLLLIALPGMQKIVCTYAPHCHHCSLLTRNEKQWQISFKTMMFPAFMQQNIKSHENVVTDDTVHALALSHHGVGVVIAAQWWSLSASGDHHHCWHISPGSIAVMKPEKNGTVMPFSFVHLCF